MTHLLSDLRLRFARLCVSCARTATLVLACGCASAATPPASPGVPPLLVAALMEGRGSRTSPEVLVGKVPPGYPAQLIPGSPTRVMGGVVDGGQIQVVFEDSTRRVAAVLEELFERAGYQRPSPPQGSGFMTGMPSSGFCGDSGIANVQALGGAQRYMARASFVRGAGRLGCTNRVPMEIRPTVRLVIPELKAPPGSRMGRAGSGSGGDEVSSSGELSDTTMAPEVVLAHYATQLSAAGWTGFTPGIGVRVASQFFEARDSSGGRWSGTLMVTRGRPRVLMSIIMRADTQR